MKLSLPEPDEELVIGFIEKFDKSQIAVDRALGKLFRLFPTNTSLEDVLLKVVTLNSLYATGILATYRVAEHIQQLQIDPLLQSGDPQAVAQIAQVRIGNKIRNNYSFASKYCAWHNPRAYPIFDGFVEQMLWNYQRQDSFCQFRRQDLREYKKFRQAIDEFCHYYHLTKFGYKEIDKFLWLAGKEYFPTSP
ncbi:MAG: hypothetical protein KJZ86_19065 [Caldilineaceae bacterium]|nr:hypothetical protein [Caldilineaceae bacterium]